MPTSVPQNVKLKIVANYGNSQELKNVLFLSEGFAQNDEELFNRAVHIIIFEILRTSPFDLLKDKFIFYSAFTPSPQSGITVTAKVDCNGFPEASYQFEENNIAGILNQKDSALGLKYGNAMDIGPKTGDEELIPNLLASLDHPSEQGISAVPDCWQRSKKDFGLVFVLINDDYADARHYGNYAVISIGTSSKFSIQTTSEGLDHQPDAKTDNQLRRIAQTLLHEMGHAFGLGDEYADFKLTSIFEPEDSEGIINLVTRSQISKKDSNGQTIFPVFNNHAGSIKWLDQPLFPGSDQKIVAQEVRDFMATGKALYEVDYDTTKGVWNNRIAYPINDFWKRYPELKIRWRYHPGIIGLYEGGGYYPKNVFRSAGICKMRVGQGLEACSVKLHSLPPEVCFSVTNEYRKIFYDEVNQELICYGEMLESIYNDLLSLSQDSEYQQAVKILFKLSNSPEHNAVFFHQFCYWCQYVIVSKVDQSRLEELAKKRYRGY